MWRHANRSDDELIAEDAGLDAERAIVADRLAECTQEAALLGRELRQNSKEVGIKGAVATAAFVSLVAATPTVLIAAVAAAVMAVGGVALLSFDVAKLEKLVARYRQASRGTKDLRFQAQQLDNQQESIHRELQERLKKLSGN